MDMPSLPSNVRLTRLGLEPLGGHTFALCAFTSWAFGPLEHSLEKLNCLVLLHNALPSLGPPYLAREAHTCALTRQWINNDEVGPLYIHIALPDQNNMHMSRLWSMASCVYAKSLRMKSKSRLNLTTLQSKLVDPLIWDIGYSIIH